MAGLKEPRPGMGQDEKDRLGKALAEARAQDELVAQRAAELARWTPDETLDSFDREQLLAEAELRRVTVRANASEDTIRKALVSARDEATEAMPTDQAETAGGE